MENGSNKYTENKIANIKIKDDDSINEIDGSEDLFVEDNIITSLENSLDNYNIFIANKSVEENVPTYFENTINITRQENSSKYSQPKTSDNNDIYSIFVMCALAVLIVYIIKKIVNFNNANVENV